MDGYNKFHIRASILKGELNKEISYALSIPPPEERQPDLQYITSVFVSSGFNLNLAYFLPSELIKSRDTIVDKPLDIEHEQDKVVGHLCKSAFAYKDGTMFDPVEAKEQYGTDVDKLSMDILASAKLYRARYPELAQDVSDGKYSVSMECYFKDYDIIVNNIIIPKIEAKKAGLIKAVDNTIKVVEGDKSMGVHKVGRVLRDMLFSGCGLVENPANPDSVILETASKSVMMETASRIEDAAKRNATTDDYVLDLTKVESYMKAKQEKETIVIHNLEGQDKDSAYISAVGGIHSHEISLESDQTFVDGEHHHVILPDSVPEGQYVYFSHDGTHRHQFDSKSGKISPEESHTHKFYVEYEDKRGDYKVKVYETGPAKKSHVHEVGGIDVNSPSVKGDGSEGTKGNFGITTRGGIHYHELKLKDGTKIKTLTPQDILRMDKDEAGVGSADGVDQIPEPEICVSFKRYVYSKGGDNPGEPANADKTPGLVPQVESLPAPTGGGAGNTITQNDEIVHENWCALFETACTTPAGQATHPKCLRLVLGRTTKEAVADFFERIEKERSNKQLADKIQTLKDLVEEASKLF